MFDFEGLDIIGLGYLCLKDLVFGCFNVVLVVNWDVLLFYCFLVNLDNV